MPENNLIRRILESTGATHEMTEEQILEVIHHVEDSVDRKVLSGRSELEAVTEAMEELGDLRQIARQYPKAAVAGTPEGWTMATPYEFVTTGSFLICVFLAPLLFMVPIFREIYQQIDVPMPSITVWLLDLSHLALSYPVLAVIGTVAVPVALCFFLRRTRTCKPLLFSLRLGTAFFLLFQIGCLAMPFLGALEGLAQS